MLYLLATPIGNLADISIRALETLEACDKILCEDTRVARKFINLLNTKGFLKKREFSYFSMHSHNEDSRLESLDVEFFSDNIIFMSDAGMPCISDPGAKLVKFMQVNNLDYTIIPGACSVSSAFALSGFESQSYQFLSFLPHKKGEKTALLGKICESSGVYVFFESCHRILETLEILSSINPQVRVFAVKEITKMYERFFFGSANEVKNSIQNANINGEWVLVLQGEDKNAPSLGLNEIYNLDLPPKIKAKLIAKLTNKSVNECYDEMLESPRERQNPRDFKTQKTSDKIADFKKEQNIKKSKK